jgi:glycine/D-amino acid oxidase-like deaminating enzyme
MTLVEKTYDTIFVGGGFYGSFLALEAARERGRSVLLVERDPDLLCRASYGNQARVHNGYHYPRSVVTGIRSRVNLPRFYDEFRDCIDDSFEKYYAIARGFSNVDARQFALFCDRIAAPLKPAPERVRALFNDTLIEDVFEVREMAFDATRLRKRMRRELASSGVEVETGVEAVRVKAADEGVRVTLRATGGAEGDDRVVLGADVFNCTYARINQLLAASGLPLVPLKHELAEIALVRVPEELAHMGVTVMCGPFFSLMPFPPRGLHSLTHVRYTPHAEWRDGDGPYRDPYRVFDTLPRSTRFPYMVKDAARYLPLAADVDHIDSLWEIKTVLPKNEVDDGRPILFKPDHGIPHLHCVMGSKIDNVYDVLESLQAIQSLAVGPA